MYVAWDFNDLIHNEISFNATLIVSSIVILIVNSMAKITMKERALSKCHMEKLKPFIFKLKLIVWHVVLTLSILSYYNKLSRQYAIASRSIVHQIIMIVLIDRQSKILRVNLVCRKWKSLLYPVFLSLWHNIHIDAYTYIYICIGM